MYQSFQSKVSTSKSNKTNKPPNPQLKNNDVKSTTKPSRGTGSSGSGERGWRETLNAIADMDLWGDTKREERPEWRDYIDTAGALLRKPRKPLPKDIVDSILYGDLGSIDVRNIPVLRNKIIVFVSSTFTDTKAERNTLMRDVFPYVRSLCRLLGLDFGPVDMRWGVNVETTMTHATTSVCIQEVDRCIRESAGPSFLAILSHKYGFRPFPPEIEQNEFNSLRKQLLLEGEDASTMDQYFQLDMNMVPPHYILKPRQEGQADWWDIFEKLQSQLRHAAAKCLSEEDKEKYFISVTENEMKHGLFKNDSADSQVILMRRVLGNVRDKVHRHRHIIDVVDGEIDEEAQEQLKMLSDKKISDAAAVDSLLDFNYDEIDEAKVKEYVRKSCDSICSNLCKSVLKNYEDNLHVEEDPVFSEALQHRSMIIDKCELFVGRDDLLRKVTNYMKTDNKNIYVLHGRSGCGKTALMAKCAQKAHKDYPGAVTVVRLLGTTGSSGSARAMLFSICSQITRAFEKDTTKIPSSYKELIPYFEECLTYSSSVKPLIIFLDSLDQLSNEDFGQNLKWLPLRRELPGNTHIIVSTLPGQCLEILQGFVPEPNLVEVKPLTVLDGPPILDKMLAASNRTLTTEQRKIVLDAFGNCPLPLYLRLATDVALKWHSYDNVQQDELAVDMPGLISTLFSRLESKYGKTFVHHALAYITVAKNGLSVEELQDILSCDNEVLDEIFTFWIPPFIKIPPLLWIRIRYELGTYLVERGADGINTYNWYHRQFWETAEERFIRKSPASDSSFERAARIGIADYFQGKWCNGKDYTHKKGNKGTIKENRHIADQPLVITGNREVGRMLNRRKLTELSHQLIKLQDWESFKHFICNLEFIESKFEVQQGYQCVSEFIEATKLSNDDTIKAFSKFISSGSSHILSEPDCIYQLASQQPTSNIIYKIFQLHPKNLFPHLLTIDQNPMNIEDPCQMTLRGHTSGIRCCDYSPNGDLIASCGEDGSLRIWDAFSGAEIVTVTGLPGPTYPGLADPYHGERPCCFSKDGLQVATGSEDGWLQVWDLAGAQVYSNQLHTAAITMIVFSPDKKNLVTCSKDGTAKFLSTNWESVGDGHTVNVGAEGLGCDYSPDGKLVAVGCRGSMVIVDAENYIVETSCPGYSSLNLGACFSPQGTQIASGGDNSCVNLWDVASGAPQKQLVGHKGWVWCVKYTSDGSKLLSCSSDRTMKMWDVKDGSCLISLGGHLHRVSHLSIKPVPGDTFVTASLDFSLKIWDFNAVLNGQVPPVGGLHYTCLDISPGLEFFVTCQGWSTQCAIKSVKSGETLASSSGHPGCITALAFSCDGKNMVTVDTGHSGQYSEGAVYNAHAIVSSLPNGEHVSRLDVRGPYSVVYTDKYIILGTADGKLHVFDLNDYGEIASWNFKMGGGKQQINGMTWNSKNGHLAVICGPELLIWDISTDLPSDNATTLSVPPTGADFYRCLFSPDGKFLVTSDVNGSTQIWKVSETGYVLLQSLVGHSGMLRDLSFSPTGRFLATVAVGMSLRIWDVADTGFTLRAVWFGPVNQLAFVKENVLLFGEATGNLRRIEFPA